MASTPGRVRRPGRAGCSADWPARKRAAAAVRTRRMESLSGWAAVRAAIMFGILMVATEPLFVCVCVCL